MPARKVTDDFQLKLPVPFVNVDVTKDNPLFIDPSAIRVAANRGDEYAKRAHKQLVEFFAEIIVCARSSRSAYQRRGLKLLQSMHEPNETRLGYSSTGMRGHAFADEMGERLWEAIKSNRALKSGTGPTIDVHTALLSRLEHLPLFIDRVDRDMISDMTTRIVFDVLCDFTLDMIVRYPSIGATRASDSYPIWNGAVGDFVKMTLNLPIAAGKPLLLVPTSWVYWRPVMDPDQFYNRFATKTIQDEQTSYTSDGKANKPSKKQIKKQNKAVKSTNVRQAIKYAEEHDRSLVSEFEREIDVSHEPLTKEELNRRLG